MSESESHGYTLEELAKHQESRILSDAELIKGDAHYKPQEQGIEPRLDITDQQIQKIRAESHEEQKALIEQLKAKEHENINAFEKDITNFIETFPVDDPSKDDIKKLLDCLYSTGRGYTDGSRRQDNECVGEFAANMNFPVEVTKRAAGMHGMATRIDYNMGEGVKETAAKILQEADEKLVPLAIQVAEKQLLKPTEELNKRLGEIEQFIRSRYPSSRSFSIEEVYKLLGQEGRDIAGKNLGYMGHDNADVSREGKVHKYRLLIEQYFGSREMKVDTISSAIKFLDLMKF
jgi:hypothetical protein